MNPEDVAAELYVLQQFLERKISLEDFKRNHLSNVIKILISIIDYAAEYDKNPETREKAQIPNYRFI